MTKVRRVKFIFTKVNICFKMPVNLIKQLESGENHVIFLNIFVLFHFERHGYCWVKI